jgi:uncharacterized repeat protein (TIGR01451 family)
MVKRLPLFLFTLFLFLPDCSFAQQTNVTKWVVGRGHVTTVARGGNTLYLGGRFNYIGPRTGPAAMLNRSDGRLHNNRTLDINGQVLTAVEDGQGGWYIGGYFTQVQGVARNGIAHILADNSLDLNWDLDITYLENPLVYLLVKHGNTLYLGGSFNRVGAKDRFNLAAVDLASLQTTDWNPRMGGSVRSLVVTDTSIYVGGLFLSIGGKYRANLAELNPTTGDATEWDMGTNAAVNSLALHKQTLYLSGDFTLVRGVEREYLAAIDLAASQVTDWQPAVGTQCKLVIAGTRLYIGGGLQHVDGHERRNLASFDLATGQLTDWVAWSPRSVSINDLITFSVSGNTVYMSGRVYNGWLSHYLAAIDATTGLKTDWEPGVDGQVNCLAVAANSVFVSGEFESVGGKMRNHVAAIDVTTGQVTDWHPEDFSVHGDVNQLLVANNLVYIMGAFPGLNGSARLGINAVDPITGVATPWNPKVELTADGRVSDGLIAAMAVQDGLLYLGGKFTSINGVPRKSAAAIALATGQLTDWNPGVDGSVTSLAVTNELVYVGGAFTRIGGKPRIGLGAVSRFSGQVINWSPQLEYRSDYSGTVRDGTASSLKVSNNTLYVAGTYTHVGGHPKNGLAAIDIPTNQVKPWKTPPNSWPGFITVLDTVIYAGGGYGVYNGTKLTGYSTLSGRATDWNITPLPPFWKNAGAVLEAGGYVYADGLTQTVPAYYSDYYYGSVVREFCISSFAPAPGSSTPRANFIEGNVFHDRNGDCRQDAGEEPVAGVVVVAEPGPYYGSSGPDGNYRIAVDTGTYTITQRVDLIKSKHIAQTCPAPPAAHAAHFGTYGDTIRGKDFGNRVTLRPYLEAGVTSARRRRCFSSNTTLSYCNTGSLAAADVKVHLELPPHVVLVSASVPYTGAPDKHYVFEIGSLAVGQCGTIAVQDSVVCNDPNIRGLTQCTKVWITQAGAPAPSPDWDQSDVTLKARCVNNGRVRLGLYNTGTGAMTDSSAYRIYLDAKLVLSRKFKLAAGDSLMLQVPAEGQTVRLEADQRPNHPAKQSTNVTLEGCGTNAGGTVSLGFLAQLPQDDAEPEVDTECLPITDSFDPNDKLVLPAGVTAEHYTAFGQELEYTVRFQNTGNDYAYRVVVVDTLSDQLDMSTLRVVGASHPYRFTVSGKGRPVLTWTFNDINLPDSTRDQVGSNGFVKFTISPIAGLSEGTRLENFADIFFDFNPPVRTNTTLNTLYVLKSEVTGADAAIVTVCKPNDPVMAGTNQTFCENAATTLQGQLPRYGEGRWKRISGGGSIEQPHSPYTAVNKLRYGENVFEWSIADGSCANDSLRSRVTITRYAAPGKPVVAYLGVNELQSSVEGDSYQWYCNGRRLADNTRSIRADRGGIFSVKVSRGSCTSELSDLLHFRLTSPVLMLLANIYPNPAARDFSVALPGGIAQVKVTIADAQGRKVAESTTYNASKEPLLTKFSLAACRAGIYLVKIQTDDALIVKRVVLQ